jgi:hypothetical protein
VLRNDVVGRIVMKCLLSDMPELRLGLNDKIEDITFHQVCACATVACTPCAWVCAHVHGACVMAPHTPWSCRAAATCLRVHTRVGGTNTLHTQCVNLGMYEANRVVTFVPPDGEFELMRCVGWTLQCPA